MFTIKKADGTECFLSDEIYMITNDEHTDINYKKGALVRKISGVCGSLVPGDHFVKNYTTVCRVDAKVAQLRGVKIDALELQKV